ncbi:hypothetical protein ACEWY4_014724 [Coilia grayii]|uniref:Ig-like domain-containing protein n=1 Tax=Coilia grayii TaxID=363190 RepID=A0ABD1JT20_9TELE
MEKLALSRAGYFSASPTPSRDVSRADVARAQWDLGPRQALICILCMPSFIKSPDDQIGISGGVASFVCQAVGEPKPRITWMKKGKKVSSQRFEVIEFDDGSGSVLRIQPLRTHRDEAIYECTATNSVGEINTSAKLTVLEDSRPQDSSVLAPGSARTRLHAGPVVSLKRRRHVGEEEELMMKAQRRAGAPAEGCQWSGEARQGEARRGVPKRGLRISGPRIRRGSRPPWAPLPGQGERRGGWRVRGDWAPASPLAPAGPEGGRVRRGAVAAEKRQWIRTRTD